MPGRTERLAPTSSRQCSSPATPFEEFSEGMSAEAEGWHAAMGGVTPWEVFPNASRIFWIYGGIDPWTSDGVVVNTVPEGMDLHYELGVGETKRYAYRYSPDLSWDIS